uniref:Cornifelin n=1 Tax=Neogobius melanostomus TaxID=47308 RepID=A0A8C6UD07_9GOBI
MDLATAPTWPYGGKAEMNQNHYSLYHPPPPLPSSSRAYAFQVQPQSLKADDEVEWNTGLCEFEDAATCCYGFWCCPCLSCTVSQRLQEPYCLPLCDILAWVSMLASRMPIHVPPAALGLRLAMRNKYKIRGSLLNDVAVSCCCTWCSWCQMHRELKHQMRGPCVVSVENVVSVQPPPLAPMTTMGQVTVHQTATVNTGLLNC